MVTQQSTQYMYLHQPWSVTLPEEQDKVHEVNSLQSLHSQENKPGVWSQARVAAEPLRQAGWALLEMPLGISLGRFPCMSLSLPTDCASCSWQVSEPSTCSVAFKPARE